MYQKFFFNLKGNSWTQNELTGGGGWGKGQSGSVGWTWTHGCIQHGEPTGRAGQHRERGSGGSLAGRGVWGRVDTSIRLAESPSC